MPDMNEKERKCLEVLAPHYGNDCSCFAFRYLMSKTGLSRKEVRRSCRSLARKGFTAYERGLFTEDLQVAGSGYCCTKLGHDTLVSDDA